MVYKNIYQNSSIVALNVFRKCAYTNPKSSLENDALIILVNIFPEKENLPLPSYLGKVSK